MIEEIVLLETKMVHSDKQVFKLQFANGEFDMAVVDPDSITTEIYEIRDSTEMVPEHYKDLVDEEKCRGQSSGSARLREGQSSIAGMTLPMETSSI